MGPLKSCLSAALLALAGGALACEVPDDEGSSLRRALLKVKYLPETEAWEAQARKLAPVQFVLSLDAPIDRDGRCYWPIEARSGGTLWNTFYATPRGEDVLVVGAQGKLLSLEAWRALAR